MSTTCARCGADVEPRAVACPRCGTAAPTVRRDPTDAVDGPHRSGAPGGLGTLGGAPDDVLPSNRRVLAALVVLAVVGLAVIFLVVGLTSR